MAQILVSRLAEKSQIIFPLSSALPTVLFMIKLSLSNPRFSCSSSAGHKRLTATSRSSSPLLAQVIVSPRLSQGRALSRKILPAYSCQVLIVSSLLLSGLSSPPPPPPIIELKETQFDALPLQPFSRFDRS